MPQFCLSYEATAQDQDGSLPQLNAQAVRDDSIYGTLGELRFDGQQIGDYLDILVDKDGQFLFPIVPVFIAGEAVAQQQSAFLWELSVASLGINIRIDLAAYELFVNDQPVVVAPGDLLYDRKELFIRPELVAEVSGLTIDFDSLSMVLDVKTTRPWPRVLREAREMRWRRMGYVVPHGPQPLPLENPYSLYSAALANIHCDYSDTNSQPATFNYTVQAVSEALFMTNNITLSGTKDNELSSAHITSGRTNPQGGVFGLDPLYAVEFGDVSGLSIPLAGSSGSGVGLKLRAAPLTEPESFDVTVVEGDAPPGWDAELYIDNQIYDYQRIGTDGRYRFEDIPLDYGDNAIRVVLYGPAGETREIDSSQIVGSRLKPGQVNWWAHVGRPGTKVYLPDADTDSDYGVITETLQVDVGVTRNFKLGLNYGHLLRSRAVADTDEDESEYQLRDYFGIKLQPTFQGFSLSGEVTFQEDGAKAYALRGSVPLFGTSIGMSYEFYDEDFQNSLSALESSQKLKFKASVRGSLPLNLIGQGLGNISWHWDRQQDCDGAYDDSQELVYAHRINPLALSHRFTRQLAYDSSGQQTSHYDTYRGLFSYRNGLFSARGDLNYDLYPQRRFSNAALSSSYAFHDRTVATAGLSYAASGTIAYSASVSRLFKDFSLSLSGGYSDGSSSIGLGLEFGFGHVSGYSTIHAPRMALDSGIALLNIRSEGAIKEADLPLNNIRAVINKHRTDEETDAKGQLVLPNLDTLHPAVIAVERQTLPDPFLVTDVPEVMFWPRAGQVVPVDLHLQEASFVSGEVAVITAKKLKIPVRQLRIQLLNPDGLVVAETISLGDGFYQFETAYAGSWSVRLAPEQPGLKKPLTTTPLAFEIEPGVLDLTGINLLFHAGNAAEKNTGL